MPNHSELLEILLNNRGIKRDDWDNFLNPSYEKGIYDPFLLKDMEKAVIRIFESIEANEKIVIYSDYDADGIPAAVIMHDFFEKIKFKNFIVYIPDRHDEGYGLHMDAIKEFTKTGVNLIITFDLGITAIEEITEAKINNIDVIVIDHHLPKRENEKDLLPPAIAVIDPKREDCDYPDSMLCGAGLAFKLVLALIKKYGEYWDINNGWEKWLLDMAGVATLSDQVPLLNENRVLAYYGLFVLRKTKRQGLVELFKKAGVELKNINEEDVTFTLTPRINVASRMANPMTAFELLSEKDGVKAKALSDMLDKINNQRKVSVAQIMKDVKHTLEKRFENEDYKENKFIVIGNPNWHIGVLGIVASKIVDEYKRTVFVWGGDGDIVRGSCRAYGEINLVDIMSSLPENTFYDFGGHKMAGGFSVSKQEIHFLEERLNIARGENKMEENLDDNIIDAFISIDDVTKENYKVIERLAPYGAGNPKPTFMFRDVTVFFVKEFGKEKNHLELSFKNSKGKIIKAIAFFKTRDSFVGLSDNSKIDIIANFEKSYFLGKEELRLRIVDIVIK
jgi:single-stranded-DNA-specific exonuclease